MAQIDLKKRIFGTKSVCIASIVVYFCVCQTNTIMANITYSNSVRSSSIKYTDGDYVASGTVKYNDAGVVSSLTVSFKNDTANHGSGKIKYDGDAHYATLTDVPLDALTDVATLVNNLLIEVSATDEESDAEETTEETDETDEETDETEN